MSVERTYGGREGVGFWINPAAPVFERAPFMDAAEVKCVRTRLIHGKIGEARQPQIGMTNYEMIAP